MVEGLPHLRGDDSLVGQFHGVLDEQHGEYIPVAGGDTSALQSLQAHGTAGVCLRLSPLGDPVDVVKAQDTDFKALLFMVVGADFLSLGDCHAPEADRGFLSGFRQVLGIIAAEDLLGGKIYEPSGADHGIGGENVEEGG